MAVRPYSGGRFEKIGSEEAHTIETFERRIHGTPYSDPKREFSSNQYTERRTYGRDENGDVVVKIEKNPSEPVRPVTPVRPVSPIGEHKDGNLLKPIQPLSIPRIDIRNTTPSSSPHRRYSADVSPRSVTYQLAPASPRSAPLSPRSNSSAGSANIPLKKVTKKSRWVSIHDGRPVSPYTETVTFEPAFPDRYSSASHRSGLSARSTNSISPRPHKPISRKSSECAFIMENPLYRD